MVYIKLCVNLFTYMRIYLKKILSGFNLEGIKFSRQSTNKSNLI